MPTSHRRFCWLDSARPTLVHRLFSVANLARRILASTIFWSLPLGESCLATWSCRFRWDINQLLINNIMAHKRNKLIKFSAEEIDLLKKHRVFLEALDTGKRGPKTKAQQHFKRVTFGKADPETVYERTYLKFRNAHPRQKPPFLCDRCDQDLSTEHLVQGGNPWVCEECLWRTETSLNKSCTTSENDLFGFSYGGGNQGGGLVADGGFSGNNRPASGRIKPARPQKGWPMPKEDYSRKKRGCKKKASKKRVGKKKKRRKS
jgi:uncharacterized protein YifE (UPF0438 family)